MQESTTTVAVNELASLIPEKFTLIGCISHEDRCTSIVHNTADHINSAIFFQNRRLKAENIDSHLEQIVNSLSKYNITPNIISVDCSVPTNLADSFAKIVEELSSQNVSLVIDTTTFTHEALVMLLKIIHRFRGAFKSIHCLYVGANEYSPGMTPEETWLSKGCKDVHNIIGFPGLLRPRAKTNLVILAGFELERATRLIELIEPDKLIIGNGIDPVCDNHSEKMSFFRQKMEHWKTEYKYLPTHNFEFSCKDISHTVQEIKKIIKENPDDNYILVPLNTKLSTVAATLVGLENRNIQLCYAVPETYNFDNYSSAGNNVTVVDLLSFDVFSQQYN